MGRGLHNFIRDLKNAATPDKEAKRVAEELAKIRAKFRGDKELDAYSKKKCLLRAMALFVSCHSSDSGLSVRVSLRRSLLPVI